MYLIEPILQQMSSVAKPQRKFMFILLTTLTYLPGRVNFRNLGRYSALNEKTFSRWFRRSFDFVTFNLLSLKDLTDKGEWVAAIDASFLPKSGRNSYGLDWFWNGSQGQSERGLEISLLALVDVTHNTAYTLSAYQTPALPKAPKVPEVVNSPTFKRNLRIVYIVREEKGKIYTALLFCTDTDCAALDILRYYKARFQIEFVFRDAKQYTGVCDCQATSEAKLGFHFNASLTALNLLRLEDRQQAVEGAGRNVISIASWKTRKFNAHLLERFSCHLGIDFTAIKSSQGFAALCNYGAIAA